MPNKKKVFLFNTHINNIINAPQQLLKHLETIIHLFEVNQELVLLWRPHPLSIPTMKRLAPELNEPYQDLVERFKRMPNGIYDTSSDLYRAIAVSDAYIGDRSSVVKLYQATGKPVWVSEPLCQISKNPCALPFLAGAYKDGWLYFSAAYLNGLFKLCPATGEIRFLGIFSTEQTGLNLHQCACLYDKFCIFAPRLGTCITKVDLDSGAMTRIGLPKQFEDYGKRKKFKTAVRQGRNLFLLPESEPFLLKLDMETDRLTVLDQWPGEVGKTKAGSAFCGMVLIGKRLLLCPDRSGYYIAVDTESGKMAAYPSQYGKQAFGSPAFDGKRLWLAPSLGGKIVSFDVTAGKCEEYGCPVFCQDEEPKFSKCAFFGGEIWMFPKNAGDILRVNPETGNIKVVRGYEGQIGMAGGQRRQPDFESAVEGDRLYVPSLFADSILCAPGDKGEYGAVKLTISWEEMGRYMEENRRAGILIPNLPWMESSRCMTLQAFMSSVCEGRNEWEKERVRACAVPADGEGLACGQRIWDHVTHLIQNKNKEAER